MSCEVPSAGPICLAVAAKIGMGCVALDASADASQSRKRSSMRSHTSSGIVLAVSSSLRNRSNVDVFWEVAMVMVTTACAADTCANRNRERTCGEGLEVLPNSVCAAWPYSLIMAPRSNASTSQEAAVRRAGLQAH